jgi:TRAP-type transport system periplasmic protein
MHCRRPAVLVLAFLMLWGGLAAADTYKLEIATVAPKKTPWAELLALYEANVEKASGGRIEVKVFFGGNRGAENEAVRKVAAGNLQGVGASTGALASLVPELNAVELPFLFKGSREPDYVLDKKLTGPMEALFRKRGLVFGFWSENGYRQFGTSWGPVHSPGDFAGKPMRSQQSPVHIWMWEALKANVRPIPSTEVTPALQKGTVKGFDQSLLFAIATGWHKALGPGGCITVSDHIYQPAAIAFNAKWFDGLPPDLQKILIDEGRKITDQGRLAIRQLNPDLIKIVQRQGIQVSQLTPAERASFEAATAGVRTRFRREAGADAVRILDLIEQGIREYRAGKR